MPIMSRDHFGAVYLPLGVFYNRVPKAANTTVLSLLNELQTGLVEERSTIKGRIVRPSHLFWRDARRFYNLFKFTFVRNPFERILSAWLNKVVEGDAKYQIYPGFRDNSQQSFSRFLTALEAGELYNNRHWRPQCSVLMLPLSQFDFVGRVERFAKDFSVVLDSIERSIDYRDLDALYPTDKGKATKAKELLGKYYTRREVASVLDLYSTDFDELGYSKYPHWT